jgi:hypothetical protein
MDNLSDLLKPVEEPAEKAVSVVRKETSYWQGRNGSLNTKVSLIPMKRQSEGWQCLQEAADNIGAEDTWGRITNV